LSDKKRVIAQLGAKKASKFAGLKFLSGMRAPDLRQWLASGLSVAGRAESPSFMSNRVCGGTEFSFFKICQTRRSDMPCRRARLDTAAVLLAPRRVLREKSLVMSRWRRRFINAEQRGTYRLVPPKPP